MEGYIMTSALSGQYNWKLLTDMTTRLQVRANNKQDLYEQK